MRGRRLVGGLSCAGLLAVGFTWNLWHGRLSNAGPLPEFSPPTASQAEEPRPVRLLAGGDLMLGTSVKQTMLDRGADYPFRKYAASLRKADLAFANLETPLSDRGTPTPGKTAESLRGRENFVFRTPPIAAEGLRDAGFDVLSVANNHVMDYGPEALEDTLTVLRESGISPIGAGEDLAEAGSMVVLKRGGQRFAFLAASDVLPPFSAADRKHPGIAPARGAWFERHMPAAIDEARKRADWVLVSVHWGKELNPGTIPKQVSLGHRLIDWGADVVIGHHPHCLEPVERYHGGLIHYSLGNFICSRTLNGGGPAWEITFTPGERPRARSLVLGRSRAKNQVRVIRSRRALSSGSGKAAEPAKQAGPRRSRRGGARSAG